MHLCLPSVFSQRKSNQEKSRANEAKSCPMTHTSTWTQPGMKGEPLNCSLQRTVGLQANTSLFMETDYGTGCLFLETKGLLTNEPKMRSWRMGSKGPYCLLGFLCSHKYTFSVSRRGSVLTALNSISARRRTEASSDAVIITSLNPSKDCSP